MNKIISSKSAKFAAGLVGVIAGFAMIATTVSAATFSTNLKQGSTGADVKNLQMVLNMSADTQVSASGAGAPGNETSYFGPATKRAVIKFQNKYASEVLAPAGLTSGTGFVGALTRAKLNTLGGSITSTTPSVTVPAGSGVSVSAASQPANGLAIQGASRVAFTKLTLTAGSSDVVVNGVTVERQGAAVDANFSGIVLLQDDGTQLDIAKTLGSTHRATIGGTFTVKAGTSMNLTVAGNMASSLSSYAGQVASLAVVAVNTSSTVAGTLPVVGAMHTINGTLTIGTVTAANSSYDPQSAISKEIGSTGYKFTAMRITAGSAEDVRMKSVRFYQAGSVGSSDIANVMIYVDGTAYNATVSSDGKYYGASFGSGIVIAKGNSKDIWIQGDIVGTGAAGRTVRFDLQKNTDLYLVGETYGQGLIYTGTVNSTSSTATPAVTGYTVTVSAGSVTTVSKATTVAAGNIAVNVPNQILGGFVTDLKGEAISVQSLVFTVATSSTGAGQITNISLYDENGTVVAGPVDMLATSNTITFTDTVTFPIGKRTYTLKGKLPSTFANNGTITISTTPSSGWTNVTGQTTGNTISLSTLSSAVTMNTMTVKGGALSIAVSATPAAQTLVAGTQNFTFTNYQLDATASGEDVRFSSIPLKYTYTGTPNYISACQLYDGGTALNTGSNVVSPSATLASATDVVFTFDSSLTVTKGTAKTLALNCTISSSATSSSAYNWGLSGATSTITVTGASSGADISETVTASVGPVMTIGASSYAVTKDSSNPSYSVVAAGTTGVTLAKLKVSATNDAVNLQQIALQLTNTASSSQANLVGGVVSVYNGATLVGTGVLSGSTATTTVAYLSGVTVPKDGSIVLTIKGDISPITNNSEAASNEGALLAVDYDFQGQAGTTTAKGSGGANATNTSTGDTAVDGVRIFASVPTFARITTGVNTVLAAGTAVDLYRFSVTANAASRNGLTLGKVVVNVATSTGSNVSGTTTVTNLKMFAYTDSAFSTPVSGYTNGQVVANVANPSTATTAALSPVLAIPAGQTYYFKVTGDVALTAGTGTFSGTITTKINGDSAYQVTSGLVNTYANVAADANGALVWSPNATTTSSATMLDWTNGYGLSTVPSSGLDTITISK